MIVIERDAKLPLVEVHDTIEIKPGELRCPRCFSRDIVPSLPRGLLDSLMGSWGRIPKHCRACGRRFYIDQGDVPET